MTEGRDGGHEAVAARSDAIEPGAGVLLKDFGAYAQARTAELKAHAERLAAEAGYGSR